MQLLKEKNYFTMSKEEWFTEAIKQQVYSSLSELDFDEMRHLERKYKLSSKADEL